jgi:hypothetical protein
MSTEKLRGQIELLSGRGNEVQNDSKVERYGVRPFNDHHRYELGEFNGATAELPVGNERMRGG